MQLSPPGPCDGKKKKNTIRSPHLGGAVTRKSNFIFAKTYSCCHFDLNYLLEKVFGLERMAMCSSNSFNLLFSL